MANRRVQEIPNNMRELQEELAVVALLNDNIDVEEVTSSVKAEIRAGV